jgi:lactate dehydrogenase-like 2-hydroxyacid dehydrogenase
MTNAVVTPHTGSYTDLGVRAMHEGVVDQLWQIFRGERPPFLLNPEAWPGRVAEIMLQQS